MTVLEQNVCNAIISMAKKDEPDYWTRLEHQYAGMAMQGIVSSYEAMREISKERDIPQYVANMAFGLAHALVEKMKNKEE